MLILLSIWLLLIRSAESDFTCATQWNEIEIFSFFPNSNATILSYNDSRSHITASNGVTCGSTISSFPVNVTSICFVYTGNASINGEEYMASVLVPFVTPIGSSTVYLITFNVLNYMLAFDTVLGPVYSGSYAVIFEGNDYSIEPNPIYVLMLNLPENGGFYLDDVLITNASQIFLLTDNVAPFFYRSNIPDITINETIHFQLTDRFTYSIPAILTIIIHAGVGVGIVTLPGNITCQGLDNTICLQESVKQKLFVRVNFTTAEFWPEDRIVTVLITWLNAFGGSFDINSNYVANFILQQDLNGNFNGDIHYSGSFLFSAYLTMQAPLNLIQRAMDPMIIRGNNDGLGFNLDFPTTIPPYPSQLAFAACIARLDTVLDSCTLDPTVDQAVYLDALTFSAPKGSNTTVKFTLLIWLIIGIGTCCCLIPATIVLLSNIKQCQRMSYECENVCIPWCQTCFICCCCFTAEAYREKQRDIAKLRELRKKLEENKCMRACGCCFCNCGCGCCGRKLMGDEQSDCGVMCECCDALARRRSKIPKDPDLPKAPCTTCCNTCMQRNTSKGPSSTITSTTSGWPYFVRVREDDPNDHPLYSESKLSNIELI